MSSNSPIVFPGRSSPLPNLTPSAVSKGPANISGRSGPGKGGSATAIDHPVDHGGVGPVTRRELWGWWFQDWASAVYYNVIIPFLVPLLIQRQGDNHGLGQKVVFGATRLHSTDIALYTISISVAFQAFFFVSLGGFADFGKTCKWMMFAFTNLAAGLCVGFLPTRDGDYLASCVLLILSNVAAGCSNVFYNAYLPKLVANHPDVLVLLVEGAKGGLARDGARAPGAMSPPPATPPARPEGPRRAMFFSDTRAPAAPSPSPPAAAGVRAEAEADAERLVHRRREKMEQMSNVISSRGYVMGFTGGLAFLAVSVAVILGMESSVDVEVLPVPTISLRICCAIGGLWWLLFSLFTWFWLPNRPGPEMPAGTNIALIGWQRSWVCVKLARSRLPDSFFFLLSFFIFADGYSTISSVGILFGSDELGMTDTELVIIAALVPIFAIAGNLGFTRLHLKRGVSSRSIVMMCLSIIAIVPVYAAIGFIKDSPIGLKNKWEMYLFACLFGAPLGALQSYSRSLFSDFIPPGLESQMFGLYAVTDRGSSFIGPLVVAAIKSATGSIRAGLVFTFVSIVVPIPLIHFKVNHKRGHTAAMGLRVDSDGNVIG